MRPEWLSLPAAPIDDAVRRQAEVRQAALTKPLGALGRLETLALRLAAMQRTVHPRIERLHIVVFAADHGIAAEGLSAFPQSVTVGMVRNFAQGGAAINVLARALGASLEVINLGTVTDPGPLHGVLDHRLGAGSANFTRTAAMSEHQLREAAHVGRQAAERAASAGAQLLIGGEMGIGNTTAAAALACALLRAPPGRLAGPGTGLGPAGVARKAEVIRRALALHHNHLTDPWESLRRLGGFEIAALVGSFIAGAQRGIPVLIDGFIAGVAALTAAQLCASATDWMIFSHASAEPGHVYVLKALKAQPLLDLGMRLGEGSGAAVAVPLLRLACALHNEMSTFAEAGISGRH